MCMICLKPELGNSRIIDIINYFWDLAGGGPGLRRNVRKDLKTTLSFKRTFFYYWGKLSPAVDGEVQYEKLKSIVICVTLSASTTVHALIFFDDVLKLTQSYHVRLRIR